MSDLRPVQPRELWTHLQCSGCGNVVARPAAVAVFHGSSSLVGVENRVICLNAACESYGMELMRMFDEASTSIQVSGLFRRRLATP